MSNQPGRTDWAEDDEPDLATALPPPQHTKNKDGSETIVTIFLNDDGKKVKRTQRIRKVTKRTYEKAGVAERRAWPKMGLEAGRPAGPQPDTTTLGENIIFRPQVGFKSGAAEQPTAEEDQKQQQLKQMKIKCRICSGEHFTTKCPFKNTMAPEGEAGAGLADLDGDVGAATLQNLAAGGPAQGASGPGGSSYVPPHLRKGGAATGERMGGKFERDDLATLRVTNVSLYSFDSAHTPPTNTSISGFRIRRRRRAPRPVRALRSRHSCLPRKGQRNRQGQGFRFRQFRRPIRRCCCMREDGRLRLRTSYLARRVRQEGHLKELRTLGRNRQTDRGQKKKQKQSHQFVCTIARTTPFFTTTFFGALLRDMMVSYIYVRFFALCGCISERGWGKSGGKKNSEEFGEEMMRSTPLLYTP